MGAGRVWKAAAAAMLVGIGGCVTPSDILERQRCPCLVGWTCDTSRDLCVRVEDAGPRVDAFEDDVSLDGTTPDGLIADGSRPDAMSDALPDTPALADAGAGPPPPLSTACWREVAGCDWNNPTARFVLGDLTLPDANNPTLSPDGCVLYYGASGDVMEVRRMDASGAFGVPVFTTPVNTRTSREDKATITPDGLEFIFTSDRDATRTRLWRTRQTPGTWGPPVLASELDVTGGNLFDPSLAPHGRRFYFAASAPNQEIYVAERDELSANFREPVLVSETLFGLAGYEFAEPTVNHAETVLVMVAVDVRNVFQLYYATRSDWDGDFGEARLVPGDFTAANQILDVALSPDGCELFVAPRTGGFFQLVYEID